MEVHYTCKELSSLQKLLNGLWLGYLKAKTLYEFKADDENLYVSTFDGNSISAPLSQCSIYYQIAEDKMMEVLISYKDNKINFWESGFMEGDESWDEVKSFIEAHVSTTFDFVTHEPTWWQSLAQSYWLMPKSQVLKEFRFDGTTLYVSTKKGKVIEALPSECDIQYSIDNAKRMDVMIKANGVKITFKTTAYLLDDVEWGTIKRFILDTCQAEKSLGGKIADAVRKVKEVVED